jgi:hypothetical protein
MRVESEKDSAEQEGKYHTYVSHVIPWYIRVGWLIFWVFAIAYVVANFLPAVQTELLAPP